MRAIILFLILLLGAVASQAQRSGYPSTAFIGDWRDNTNSAGVSTNLLSATNQASARQALNATSPQDVTNIASSIPATAFSGVLQSSNIPPALTVTGLNIGTLSFNSTTTNAIQFTGATQPLVNGIYSQSSATLYTNSVSNSYYTQSGGNWYLNNQAGQTMWSAATITTNSYAVGSAGSGTTPASAFVTVVNGAGYWSGQQTFSNAQGNFVGTFSGPFTTTNLVTVTTNTATTNLTGQALTQVTNIAQSIIGGAGGGTISNAVGVATTGASVSNGVVLVGTNYQAVLGFTPLTPQQVSNSAVAYSTNSGSATTAGTATNTLSPFIELYPGAVARIWDGTNTYRTNWPASTTFGMNEIQQMFPWRTNGTIWSGGTIVMAAGEYDFTTPIKIVNNFTIKGAGHLSTVWVYTGPTNAYTIAAMTNAVVIADGGTRYGAVSALSLVCVPTNNLALNPISEFTFPSPNVNLEGFTIKSATDCPAILLSTFANQATLDDIGFGGPEYLNGANGGYRIGYLDSNDVLGPRALLGLYMGGDGAHLVENSDFGGLADSMVIDLNGWIKVQNLTMHVAGYHDGGETGNLYPVTSWLSDGFHIYNLSSYYTMLENIFYDESVFSSEGVMKIDSNIGEKDQTVDNPSSLFSSDRYSPTWDASGGFYVSYLHATVLFGNGSGLTNIPLTGLQTLPLTTIPVTATNLFVLTNDTRSLNLSGAVTISSGTFTGSGGGLTNLQAGSLVGTVASGNLPFTYVTNTQSSLTFTNLTLSTNSSSTTSPAALVVYGSQTNLGNITLPGNNSIIIDAANGSILYSGGSGSLRIRTTSGNSSFVGFEGLAGTSPQSYGISGGPGVFPFVTSINGGQTNWITPIPIASGGTITATNGYYFQTNAVCNLVISNGLSGIWNSNGVCTYLRYSAVGSTTFTDKALAP